MKHLPLFLLIVTFAWLGIRYSPSAFPQQPGPPRAGDHSEVSTRSRASTSSASTTPISPVGACSGDLNGDRAVDDRDVATLLANFGRIEDPSPWTRGDLNDDGRIDAADLSILLKTYGCREWAPPEAAATLTGPPPDAIPEELEPWMPGGAEVSRWSGDEGDRFTTENTEGTEEARR